MRSRVVEARKQFDSGALDGDAAGDLIGRPYSVVGYENKAHAKRLLFGDGFSLRFDGE